jgi:hypothetical protein
MRLLLTRNRRAVASLLTRPKPLLSQQLGLALFLSPKAGFTFGTQWFLDHAVLLQEARERNPWVHDYRQHVFCHQPEYLEAAHILARQPDRFLKVKLVRNPFQRAVSSYVHANRFGHADAAIGEALGRDLATSKDRFSFVEFVDYLKKAGVTNCDVHHRQQAHPAETQGYVHMDEVVWLEHAASGLQTVERRLGLPHLDLERYRKSDHHSIRYDSPGYVGEERFRFSHPKEGMLKAPSAESFYNDALRRAVAELYSEDFRRYGFDTE